jgi:hypothetical protein|tara:strand:+ start:2141 stop:2443 length:303 start_codon:yes stop_codon:yes gene_type:complete
MITTEALNLNVGGNFAVNVETTNNRGFTPEEIAERCADKIISISDTADPIIRNQAHAFRNHVVKVISLYMREAIKSDRTTIFNAIVDAGQPELAELIRRL